MDILEQITTATQNRDKLEKQIPGLRKTWLQHLANKPEDQFILNALSEEIPHKYFRETPSRTRCDIDWEIAMIVLRDLAESERLHRYWRENLSEAFREGWSDLEMPLKALAEAYGRSEDATYKYIVKQPWFKRRYKEYKKES